MKKTLLITLCILALLAGCLALSVLAADTTRTAYCQACKETVTWEPVVYGKQVQQVGDPAVHLHYYLTESRTSTTSADQINLEGAITLCLDLNGYTWQSYGRSVISGKNDNGCSTVNLMDTAGGGEIIALSRTSPATNNVSGGLAVVYGDCFLNIYSGTYSMKVPDPQNGLRTNNGGIVYAGGTLNVYGGTILGGQINKSGAAVYLTDTGKLNAYGGTITAGSSANSTGACVGLQNTSSTVTLGGDARVDDIYAPALNAAQLVIDGAYTGWAGITYKSTVSTSVGTVVGTLKNSGSIEKATLYCTAGYVLSADGTALKLAAGKIPYECPHCKQTVKWEAFTTTPPTEQGTYHYYLTKDYDTSSAKQWSVKNGSQVCLDLQGHSYTTIGRALGIGADGTLSVMDTVGGGMITARGGNNNPAGGTVNMNTAAKGFNLYSGTLAYEADPASSTKYGGTGRGGVIYAAAPVNIYGGTIIGGDVVDTTYEFTGVEAVGGAIYANADLNIYGGEILSGTCPESGAGPCIYVANTSKKIFISGDAKVDDITFPGFKNDQLTVSGAFTGKLRVTYPSSVVLSERMQIGLAANDCDLKKADITCGDYFIHAEGGKLILSTYSAGIPAATGGVGYNTLQAAIDASTDGYVELLNDTPETVTVSKDITLQLNGCSVTGGVQVAEGATLFVMDSATADYDVSDGLYGKVHQVSGKVAGAAVGGDSYLPIAEDGVYSFHCVTLQIYAMTLRLDENREPALFYKSNFKSDTMAATKIATFGVALSVLQEPTAENLESDRIKYSVHDHFEAGTLGNLGNNASTLLTGILKGQNTEAVNKRNLNLPIYGRAYCKTTDGLVLVGNLVERSLLQQLEGVDQLIPSLSANQVDAVVSMYDSFKTVLQEQALPGITEAVQKKEAGTLKILILGNSHSLDATNLLYEVFHTEAPEQKLVLGALYYSGCTIQQHKNFLTGNQQVYTYHKNDGTQPNRTWVKTDATCLDALQDEQWDIIFMQATGANPSLFNSDWKVVADYLMNHQDIAPKLALHYSWACPDDYALYLNDDAPYRHPSSYTSWRNKLERLYGVDGKYSQSRMYQLGVAALQEHLIDNTELTGRAFDLVIPTCTTVQYAYEVLGRDHEELYRDYTHLNDYGRVMVAYNWYAAIMGIEELTEVNLDEIPAALKHKNSKFPAANADGKYLITDDMKADLLEAVNWTLKNPFGLPEE